MYVILNYYWSFIWQDIANRDNVYWMFTLKKKERIKQKLRRKGKNDRSLLFRASSIWWDLDQDHKDLGLRIMERFSNDNGVDNLILRRPLDTRCSLATAEVVVEVVAVEEETNPTTTSEVKISWWDQACFLIAAVCSGVDSGLVLVVAVV